MTATATPAVTPPREGDQAPDFALPSTSGQPVTLSALRGTPVLVAFFPLAFSGTCTAEFCEMRDEWERFAARGVVVLPISVDHTYSLKAYREHHGFQTAFLSDFKREVSRAYGVLLDEKFYANRAYFLIDRDGVVRWAHVEEHPGKRRDSAEILARIDRLG